MQVYTCPICDREQNRRGDPFDDPEQVVSHITGSHHGDHQGERGESYRDDLEPVERDEKDVEPDPSDSPGVAEVRRSLEEQIEYLADEVARVEEEQNTASGELYELVEEQRAMIGELIEMVEVLSMAVGAIDNSEYRSAIQAHSDGAESGVDWDGDAYEFVEARYR